MTCSMPDNPKALSKKINAALPLFNDCKSRTRPKDGCNSKFLLYEAMLNTYMNELNKDRNKFQQREKSPRISSEFPFHNLIAKSKVLADQKLFEAVLYCEVFRGKTEFPENYKYEGELIWITGSETRGDVLLVSENQIVYDMDIKTLLSIRQNMRKTWAVFKEKVEKNLIEAFSMPESPIGECSNALSTSVANYIRYHMTDEMKKIMLRELIINLITCNLDAGIKQQFVVDLKDYLMDSLRLCSNIAEISSSKLEWERKFQANLVNCKKMTDNNEVDSASTTDQVKSTMDHQFRSQELLKLKERVGHFSTEANSLIEKLTNLKEEVTRKVTVWKIPEMEAKALEDSIMPQLRKLNEAIDSFSRA